MEVACTEPSKRSVLSRPLRVLGVKFGVHSKPVEGEGWKLLVRSQVNGTLFRPAQQALIQEFGPLEGA